MRILRAIGLAWGSVCLASAALADASAYQGLYRPTGAAFADWDCTRVGAPGGALQVTPELIRGVESRCELHNPAQINGMNATLFDAQCAGEGSEWQERVLLMRHEDGIYYIRDGIVAEWRRCPGA